MLALMSVATWYLIVTKAWSNWSMRRRARTSWTFLGGPGHRRPWRRLKRNGVNDPFSHLTHHGLRAVEQHRDRARGAAA
jgi:biopolymer transport protein ExbB